MEHHHIHVQVNKVQERCRVCGPLLVAPRDKKSRWSYQCTESHSNTNNPAIHRTIAMSYLVIYTVSTSGAIM